MCKGGGGGLETVSFSKFLIILWPIFSEVCVHIYEYNIDKSTIPRIRQWVLNFPESTQFPIPLQFIE